MIKAYWIVFIFATVSLFLPRTANSESKPAISITEVRVHDGVVKSQVSVRSVEDSAIHFEAKDPIFNQTLNAKAAALPIRLIMLVDASSLCGIYKIDAYVASLVGRLKGGLPKRSTVSVTSFTSSSLETLAPDLPIHCEPRQNSASYEKALLRSLETVPKDDLKTVVWVLTSGNISLTPSTVAELAKREIAVNLILYNSIMEKELAPLVDLQNASGGRKTFSLSVLNRDEKVIPERWFDLDVTVPGYLKSSSLSFTVIATQKEVAVTSDTISVAVDLGKRSLWARYGTVLSLILSVMLLTALVVGMVRFYRAKRCVTCHRLLPHGKRVCLFCHDGDLGKLVGDFNGHDRHKSGKQEVFHLTRPRHDLGFRRQHSIRLTGKATARGPLATIVKEERADGKRAFLLIPGGNSRVFVNGLLSEKPRYLGNGDEISLAGQDMTFLYGGSNHEAQSKR